LRFGIGDPPMLDSRDDVETPNLDRFMEAADAAVILGVGVGASRFLVRTVPGVRAVVLGAGVRTCRAGVMDVPPLERYLRNLL
jgi:hypothetical protein